MAMATADAHRARPGLHVLTTQQRYTLRSLVAIVSLHDHWRRRAEALERQLPGLDGCSWRPASARAWRSGI